MDVRPRPAQASRTLDWIDAIKGLAIVWIVWNHISERIFGAPYAANPTQGWPPIGIRIAQLAPIGHGLSSIGTNLARYIGWTGDQGVGLFIVASGFLLALAQIRRPSTVTAFYNRRLLRIYPLWIAAHAAFVLLWLVIGKGLDPTDPRTLASVLGLRFLPSVFYYFAPAWWYIGLALQLYLIFPYLASLMQRYGALRFALWCAIIGCAARLAGLYAFGGFVDEWSRGGIFITRLPEFALGMSLAAAYAADSQRWQRVLRAAPTVGAAIAIWLAGNMLSLTLWGMSVSPLLLSASGFILAYALVTGAIDRVRALAKSVQWCGRHSYSLYLMHQPFVVAFVSASAVSRTHLIGGIVAALAATLVLAIALEWIAARGEAAFVTLSARFGTLRVATYTASLLFIMYAIFVAADALVSASAPLEVFGWGERPSLEADATVGWKLKPNEINRLRWTSYDYVVRANALGFPGPLYPRERSHGTLRIMTLGDAFTSAEGVDSQLSWPRRLEQLLEEETHRPVQVMNFAITGYGPNQYAAVVREYVPVYRPNLVVIGMFVNDFADALTPDDAFRHDIGFSNPPPNGIVSLLELQQLKAYWALRVRDPAISFLRRKPAAEGAFFANIKFFDRREETSWLAGARVMQRRYAEIHAITQQYDGRTAVVLFPASVQVCGPNDLRYYPRHFDLTDTARYDANFPQATAARVAAADDLPYHDLRPDLRASGVCPYQARNMHLTAYGQNVAAEAIASFLRREALVPGGTGSGVTAGLPRKDARP